MKRRKKRWRLSLETRRSIQRTKWALNIPYSPQTQRGLMVEDILFEALEFHQKKKTEFPGGRRIIEIKREPHFSEADRKEKDGFVTFLSRVYGIEIVPVQIKGRWWDWRVERRLREKGVCLIAIRMFTQDNKRKPPESLKKEAREKSYGAIDRWFSRIEKEKEVRAIP